MAAGSIVRIGLLLVLFWAPVFLLRAQSSDALASDQPKLELTFSVDGWLPQILDSDAAITSGIGSTTQLALYPAEKVAVLVRAGVYSMQTGLNETLLYIGGAAGLGYRQVLTDRLSLFTSGFAGLGRIPDIKVEGIEGQSYGLYETGLRLEADYRITAAIRLGLFVGYQRLATPTAAFLDAPAAGFTFQVALDELSTGRSRVRVDDIRTQPVFPVLRSWYDSEPLGTVTVRNLEEGSIENVRVLFFAPEYMSGERLCLTQNALASGAEMEVPLYAVFDERVLTLTENNPSVAEVTVEYTYFGSSRRVTESFPIEVYHRNTMTWEDDRRAAAFVSPTDPGALWFGRYAGSVARDRMRTNLPPNLQRALSIFEGLRLYGVNYVIDPNSSYIELSEDAKAVDFLQYPSETLAYRGGDCDDLSILYCSLLESSGIDTAFITVPGHIYMAFDLGLSEEEAREQFFDPGMLIFRDGRAWAPIEITMIRDGFVKAWRVGAKQWVDNEVVGTADFHPMRESWRRYPPSALPEAESRFALPEERQLMAAFDASVDRFMVREMGPVIADYEARLAEDREFELLNEYGVALATAGMLDAAWEQFSAAADSGDPRAWNNLASIAFIRKDYELAHSYYSWAQGLMPDDVVARLGMARSEYEMDRYRDAVRNYEVVAATDPELAGRFGYLASVYGGAGRAWSMADRLASTVWSKPVRKPGPEPELRPEAAPSRAWEPQPEPEPAPEPEPEAEPEAPRTAVSAPVAKPEPESGRVTDIPPSAEAEPDLGEASEPPAPRPAPPVIAKAAPEDREIVREVREARPVVIVPQPEAPPGVEVEPAVAPESKPPPEPVREPVPPIRINFLDPGVYAAVGSWDCEEYRAAMDDGEAMYAKLVIPSQPVEGKATYRFSARSTGMGFAGFGLHIHGIGSWDLSYYGGGDSILVWITSDPAAYGDPAPRLQVYRSAGPVHMEVIASTQIPGSVFELRDYQIVYDPGNGSIAVSVDGAEHLQADGLENPPAFDYLALRSLDSAEFSELTIQAEAGPELSLESIDE